MASLAAPSGNSAAFFRTAQDAALYFKGHWTLQRTMTQKSTGAAIASCEGRASLTWRSRGPIENSNLYSFEENGKMRTAANPASVMPFTQKYLYEFTDADDDSMLSIYFDRDRPEGKPLEEDIYVKFSLPQLALGVGVRSSEHLCIKDLYVGWLTLQSPSSWQLRYQIDGPNKDMIIDTSFERTEAPPPP
eukprot:TRINITY_DN29370_c0_g1_i4.p1 TRINITY_DN29370_c0_g1~~TRINITY_DN29370_c0_g1_i4.p1  ORF type:complete len:221 (-),score=33.18 TRINITY_DN29370_c0_g1_i4:5-574(-)